MKCSKKGITLVELLIALALLGTVMMVVSNFFFLNYKALNRESNEIDFQREAHAALNFIVKEAIVSKGIKEVYVNNNQELDISRLKNAANISKLILEGGNTSEERGFKVIDNGEEKQLYFYTSINNRETSSIEVSSSIKSFDITSDRELKNASNIRVRIALTKGRNPIIESQVYFRNKE